MMALRLTTSRRILKQCVTRSLSSTNAVSPASVAAPSVHDVLVKLNFVDPSGARRQVPGLVDLGPASVGGLVEKVRSSTWTEPLYGEGPTTGYDHILLVGNGADTAEPMTHAEEKALGQYWDDDEIFPESRLATQVIITKEMDGMTVYVPDRLVDDIP